MVTVTKALTVQLKRPLPSQRKGKFVAFDCDGACVGQGRNAATALSRARAKGVQTPILINLDITRKRKYIL